MTERAFFQPLSLRLKRDAKPLKWEYDSLVVLHRLNKVMRARGGVSKVAEAADISILQLRRYIYSQPPSVENLFRICQVCNISMDYIVGLPTFWELASWKIESVLRRFGISKKDFDNVAASLGFVAAMTVVWLPVFLGWIFR